MAAESATESAAAAAAPARTWRRRGRSSARGGRATTNTSRPSSIAVRAPSSHSWPDRKSSAFSICAALK